eukprot:GHVQ01009768.1.p1 GENE.GHVQ01009768.1~~GHVQ01009768.1.p1  ORF type:complete len:1138 (-),score=350.64 GHVQ01009768.1:297-3251(-)
MDSHNIQYKAARNCTSCSTRRHRTHDIMCERGTTVHSSSSSRRGNTRTSGMVGDDDEDEDEMEEEEEEEGGGDGCEVGLSVVGEGSSDGGVCETVVCGDGDMTRSMEECLAYNSNTAKAARNKRRRLRRRQNSSGGRRDNEGVMVVDNNGTVGKQQQSQQNIQCEINQQIHHHVPKQQQQQYQQNQTCVQTEEQFNNQQHDTLATLRGYNACDAEDITRRVRASPPTPRVNDYEDGDDDDASVEQPIENLITADAVVGGTSIVLRRPRVSLPWYSNTLPPSHEVSVDYDDAASVHPSPPPSTVYSANTTPRIQQLTPPSYRPGVGADAGVAVEQDEGCLFVGRSDSNGSSSSSSPECYRHGLVILQSQEQQHQQQQQDYRQLQRQHQREEYLWEREQRHGKLQQMQHSQQELQKQHQEQQLLDDATRRHSCDVIRGPVPPPSVLMQHHNATSNMDNTKNGGTSDMTNLCQYPYHYHHNTDNNANTTTTTNTTTTPNTNITTTPYQYNPQSHEPTIVPTPLHASSSTPSKHPHQACFPFIPTNYPHLPLPHTHSTHHTTSNSSLLPPHLHLTQPSLLPPSSAVSSPHPSSSSTPPRLSIPSSWSSNTPLPELPWCQAACASSMCSSGMCQSIVVLNRADVAIMAPTARNTTSINTACSTAATTNATTTTATASTVSYSPVTTFRAVPDCNALVADEADADYDEDLQNHQRLSSSSSSSSPSSSSSRYPRRARSTSTVASLDGACNSSSCSRARGRSRDSSCIEDIGNFGNFDQGSSNSRFGNFSTSSTSRSSRSSSSSRRSYSTDALPSATVREEYSGSSSRRTRGSVSRCMCGEVCLLHAKEGEYISHLTRMCGASAAASYMGSRLGCDGRNTSGERRGRKYGTSDSSNSCSSNSSNSSNSCSSCSSSSSSNSNSNSNSSSSSSSGSNSSIGGTKGCLKTSGELVGGRVVGEEEEEAVRPKLWTFFRYFSAEDLMASVPLRYEE